MEDVENSPPTANSQTDGGEVTGTFSGDEAPTNRKTTRHRQSTIAMLVDIARMHSKHREHTVDARHGMVWSGFTASEDEEEDDIERHFCQHIRKRMKEILSRFAWDGLMASVVFTDVVMTGLVIDSNALDEEAPGWTSYAGFVCLAIYTIEWVAWFFVKFNKMFSDKWLCLDTVFLLAGYTELVCALLEIPADSIGILRILRIVRIMRFAKIIRKFYMLKELRKLLMMLSSCFKALFWNFMFCFIVMTVFAMMAVDLISPIVKELAGEGMWADCDRCRRSFNTIMSANLYLFQTVIAGDSWGHVAVPVIERAWWTSFIFIGAQLVLIYGVLSMIMAVVVDCAAEERERDILQMAEDLEHDREDDFSFLRKMFRKIDLNNDGELTLEELIRGARHVPEFQARLNVMDIDQVDLEQLFYMLDTDNGGSIDPNEFMGALTRWVRESRTASRFIKYRVDKLSADQEHAGLVAAETLCLMHSIQKQLEEMTPNSHKHTQKLRDTQGGSQTTGTSSGSACDFTHLHRLVSEDLKSADHLCSSLKQVERSLSASVEKAQVILQDELCRQLQDFHQLEKSSRPSTSPMSNMMMVEHETPGLASGQLHPTTKKSPAPLDNVTAEFTEEDQLRRPHSPRGSWEYVRV
eukprot:TRINITY_DN31063_c0_g1_i1.p1 TRINITY_DN31063_c0_g1~~TRINITY_DN31063_c0_g1_i1.p1  ORF type:complete len:658 (+),score=92.96 TRINITY_DN31063_c0_g1_i1:65-1975(+)